MSNRVKAVATCILFFIQYVFVTIIYPNISSSIGLSQGTEGNHSLESFQLLQFFYSYSWFFLTFLAIMIWRKEIQKVFFPKKTL